MKHSRKRRVADVSRRFPGVRTRGFAVQYIPRYVNIQTPDQHLVDVALITFVISGTGRHLMGRSVFVEHGGSIGITHYGQMHDLLTGSEGMEVFNVYLDVSRHPLPSLPGPLHAILQTLLPLHAGLGDFAGQRVHFPMQNPQASAMFLHRLEKEQRAPGEGAEQVMRDCLRIFLIDCCRAAARVGFAAEGKDLPEWVGEIVRQIEEKFGEPLTRADLASGTGLSEAHFSREFRRHLGRSFSDYLLHRRLQAAMFQLRETTDKIFAVCQESGFRDLPNFCRQFRRLTGISPAAYRKRFARGD